MLHHAQRFFTDSILHNITCGKGFPFVYKILRVVKSLSGGRSVANELASNFKPMQRPESESASPLSDGAAKKKRGKRNESNHCSGVKVSTSGVKSTPSPKQGKRKNGSGKSSSAHSVSLHLKCDSSSSASSIDIKKPKRKLGRFEYSSSECMSTEGCAISTNSSSAVTNSSVIMDANAESPLTLSHSSMSSSFMGTRCESPKELSSSISPVAAAGMDTKSKSNPKKKHEALSSSRPLDKLNMSVELGLENLRWEDELSDEEKEMERIEKYKENRRKRYEKSLLEQKAKLPLRHVEGRLLYCSS